MKAVVYEGPRQVSVKDVPDARIERPTLRRMGQEFEQLVVQDLDLALRAVSNMEHDRAVGRVGGRVEQVLVLGQRHQVADARLDLFEQRLARSVVEEVDLRRLEAGLRRQRIVECV